VIRLRNITVALAALCVLAVAAPPAMALDNDWRHVVRECYNTGQLNGSKYTRTALKQARKHLPSDIREYSDCADLIDAALAQKAREHRQTGGGGGGTTGDGSGGGPPPIPTGTGNADPRNLDALRNVTDPKGRSNAAPVPGVSPGTRGLIATAHLTDTNSLPLPLILALAALAAMAAVGSVSVMRRRGPQVLRALRIRRH
jgi:hypothetical protein